MDLELEQELNSIIEGEAERVHAEVQIINTEIAEYLEQALYEEDDDLGQNEHYLFAIHASETKALVSDKELKLKVRLVTSNFDIYEMLTSHDNIKSCGNAVGLLLMAHCTNKAKTNEVRVTTLISEAGISAIVRKANNPTEIEKINHESIPQETQLIRTLIAFHTFTQIQKDNQ
jgi:hypothetical protein